MRIMPRTRKNQVSSGIKDGRRLALTTRFRKTAEDKGTPRLRSLSVGSTVYYIGKGLYKVEAKETLSLQTAGTFASWKLRALNRANDIVYVGTTGLAKGEVRALSPAKEFAAALQVLSEKPQKMPTLWSRRQEQLKGMLRSASPVDVANVVRNTYGRFKKDIPLMSQGERDLGDAAFKLLAEEYASLHRVTVDCAFSRLMKIACGDTASKGQKPASQPA